MTCCHVSDICKHVTFHEVVTALAALQISQWVRGLMCESLLASWQRSVDESYDDSGTAGRGIGLYMGVHRVMIMTYE